MSSMQRLIFSPVRNLDCLIELGLNDTSALVGHFVSSPREREIEEIVEEMKEREREERETGIKVKKQKK